MFIFAGRKCRSSESKRNLFILPGARLLGEAIADYVTAKKIKEQTFLNIKNGDTNDTNDMTCIIFSRNLNCL